MPTRTLALSLHAARRLTRRLWLHTVIALRHAACWLLIHDDPAAERGEGVISTAIVVVIMAFLAVGLWFAFKAILSNATTTVSNQVAQLGS